MNATSTLNEVTTGQLPEPTGAGSEQGAVNGAVGGADTLVEGK